MNKVLPHAQKLDFSTDLILKEKILPAELFIKKECILKFFDLLSQYKEQSRNQKLLFQDFWKVRIDQKLRKCQFFPSASPNGVTGD